MMRMAVKTFEINGNSDQGITLFHAVFDHGIEFLGADLWKFKDLINTIHFNLYWKLSIEANENPDRFQIHKDYLDFLD